MKALAYIGACLLTAGVLLDTQAQGFVDSPICYSWEGGHKSAGSFSKCTPELQPAKKPEVKRPEPVVTQVVTTPVAPPTILQSCPPPEPKPLVVPKKPRPKPTHKC